MPLNGFASFAPTALTRLLRLSQLASNPALIFPEEKRTPGKFLQLDGLIDQIIGDDQKVIIWSSYVETIQAFNLKVLELRSSGTLRRHSRQRSTARCG